MPLDETGRGALELSAEGRHNRPNCTAFTADAATEKAVSEGLVDIVPGGVETRRGGVRAAIAALGKAASPRVLIVDLSGEKEPLAALEELALVVEPNTCVLLVGEGGGLDFYREVTRGIGAAEYLAKPLSRDSVSRHFGPLAAGRAPKGEAALGGRLLTVTGARGGVGASTIATNLSWFLGMTSRRHTVLLDADLHMGTAAFLLDVPPSKGLSTALAAPERIDSLLAERAAQPVGDRLHVLAAQEKLGEGPEVTSGTPEALLQALRRRYNFIVGDVPFRPMVLNRELLEAAHRRVIVLDPTLSAVRDTLRLMAPSSEDGKRNDKARRPILVLNRQGLPGGLTRKQLDEALKTKVDVVIPDLPKVVGGAATLGKPACAGRGPFTDAIRLLAEMLAGDRLGDEAEKDKGKAKRGLFGFGRAA